MRRCWLALALSCSLLAPSTLLAQEPSTLSDAELWSRLEANYAKEQNLLILLYRGWLRLRPQVSELSTKLTTSERTSRGLTAKLARAEQRARDLLRSLQQAEQTVASLQASSSRLREAQAESQAKYQESRKSVESGRQSVMNAEASLTSYGVGGFLTDAAICGACGLVGAGVLALARECNE